MKFGLKNETIAQILSIFKKYSQIKKAILYGSRAKGNFKNGSDIDIVLTGEDLTIIELIKISSLLDDLLLPYTIDLSIYHKIKNPDLIEHIKRVGVAIYKKDLDEI